jgi:flagellar basal-body rod modification protein FlgD
MISPSILNPLSSGAGSLLPALNSSKLKAQDASTGATTATSSSTDSSSSQTSLTSLGSTFLQLLTQELQNQDPTAPMDSTQMVGQMISLNQLDQLASINQLLTTQFSSTGSTTTGTSPTTN